MQTHKPFGVTYPGVEPGHSRQHLSTDFAGELQSANYNTW